MLAYFLLVHRFPAQFKRLLRAIHDPANLYAVHIDRRGGAALHADIAAFAADYPNVRLIESRDAVWGGYSLVDAELRGMAELLARDTRWTHFINLSGQDYPLQPQPAIAAFLRRRPDTEFIRVLDQARIRPATLNRIATRWDERGGAVTDSGVARAMPAGVVPFIGTQWKIVTRAFCRHACEAPRAATIRQFYRGTFIPDEALFQTILMNGAPYGQIVADDLRLIDWVPDGPIKLRPRTFTTADAALLTGSANLFARKFDAETDAGILTILDAHLARGAPASPAQSAIPVRQLEPVPA